MPARPRCSWSESNQSFGDDTFWQYRSLRPHYYSQIIHDVSALRDSGQTVRFHKLTARRAHKYSSFEKNKNTVIKLNIPTLTRYISPTWQRPGELFKHGGYYMCDLPLRRECPPDPFVSVRHPERENSSSAQLWESPLFSGDRLRSNPLPSSENTCHR